MVDWLGLKSEAYQLGLPPNQASRLGYSEMCVESAFGSEYQDGIAPLWRTTPFGISAFLPGYPVIYPILLGSDAGLRDY